MQRRQDLEGIDVNLLEQAASIRLVSSTNVQIHVRREATGYGCAYFVEEMLGTRGMSFEGRRVVVSGTGNVAIHGAVVSTLRPTCSVAHSLSSSSACSSRSSARACWACRAAR